MKRAVIVHGWEGYPEEAWFPWLKIKLEQLGYAVNVPQMPEPESPQIEKWVGKLSEVVGTPDQDLILVGHSVGCQTILRYLSGLPQTTKIRGVVLVAPWVELTGLTDDEMEMISPWFDVSSLIYAREHIPKQNFHVVFSDNDKFVPLKENMEFFKKNFDPKILIEKDRGHIGGSDNVPELASILDAVSSIK